MHQTIKVIFICIWTTIPGTFMVLMSGLQNLELVYSRRVVT